MARTLADIQPLIRNTLGHFVKDIVARQGSNVVRVVLFGSVARGDDNENSDIDVFLLLKNDDADNDLVKSATLADDMNNYKTYTTPFSMSLAQYADGERIEPVIKNIRREGIVLYDAQG